MFLASRNDVGRFAPPQTWEASASGVVGLSLLLTSRLDIFSRERPLRSWLVRKVGDNMTELIEAVHADIAGPDSTKCPFDCGKDLRRQQYFSRAEKFGGKCSGWRADNPFPEER